MFEPLPRAAVELRDTFFQKKVDANRDYLLVLRSEDLLQNFYLEAGLRSTQDMPERCHGCREAPTCQLRGHFLGHWLSAAAGSPPDACRTSGRNSPPGESPPWPLSCRRCEAGPSAAACCAYR